MYNPRIKQLDPYIPGEQPQQDCIKLNTNENPYPPSPNVFKAINVAVNNNLRLYPDPNSTELTNAIADFYHVKANQVFVGNGSDEVLAHAFSALFNPAKPILFPDVSYSFYPVYCKLYDLTYQTVSLNQDFAIDVEGYKVASGGIIFANPNAPTGIYLDLAQIEFLLKLHSNSVVIVDEAYIDFGGSSAVCLIEQYPNLLVVQTLSKSRSLAGIRVGFALGNADLINMLNMVKNSFNSYPIDKLAQTAAVAALKDVNYFTQTCQKIINARDALTMQLKSLGFNVLPSKANFVFATHKNILAHVIYEELKRSNIFVRYFANPPKIANFLRITVGNDEQNKALITSLAIIIGNYQN